MTKQKVYKVPIAKVKAESKKEVSKQVGRIERLVKKANVPKPRMFRKTSGLTSQYSALSSILARGRAEVNRRQQRKAQLGIRNTY